MEETDTRDTDADTRDTDTGDTDAGEGLPVVDLRGGEGIVSVAIASGDGRISVGATLRSAGTLPGVLVQRYTPDLQADSGFVVPVKPIEDLSLEMMGAYGLGVSGDVAHHHFGIGAATEAFGVIPLAYTLETTGEEGSFVRYLESYGELTSNDVEVSDGVLRGVACGPGSWGIRWVEYTAGAFGADSPWATDLGVADPPLACAVRGDHVLSGGAEGVREYRIDGEAAVAQEGAWEPGAIAIDGTSDAWMVARSRSIEVRQDEAEPWTVDLDVDVRDAVLATGGDAVFVAVIGTDGSAWLVTRSGPETAVEPLDLGFDAVTALDVELHGDRLVVAASDGATLRAGEWLR